MFVYSCKASTLKFFGLLLAFTVVLSAAILFLPKTDVPTLDQAYLEEGVLATSAKSESEIRDFLSRFGWETEEVPLDKVSVTIPAEFDKIFTSYNNLQQRQGFDLANYKNKTVTRYTYRVKNYPDYQADVYANLFVYKDKIIGGDICSADVNGFLHGFSRPQNSQN